MKLVYPIILYPMEEHEDGYTVEVPDLPGCVTEGHDLADALDMDAYAEKYGSKAVRKNVTIPAWLDTFGERNNINYSQVLREGLESRYRALQDA